MDNKTTGHPLKTFNNLSVVAVIIGIVIGIGIFRLPPLVAQQATSDLQFISYWIAGGFISLLGALCYAELAALKPDTGGEYYFLNEAYGSFPAFIFSWGRMTVIQTGSIALAAFILGDYATLLLDLGPYSSSIYAAGAIIIITGLNLYGTAESRGVQNILASAIVLLLIGLGLASFFTAGSGQPPATNQVWSFPSTEAAGSAMIFVLLTYGGWNEAAYLSAEIKGVKKNMATVLTAGIILITAIYVLVNSAYIHILGLEALQNADTVGSNFTEEILGPGGAVFVTIIVILASLSTTNATVITGARTNYALGRDFKVLRFLDGWHKERNTPFNALLVQGAIALLLVLLGTFTEEAVATMVDYTAPVFWLFLFLSTMSIFVFRYQYDKSELPYKVPLYPLTPILFLLACAYMLYSSLAFTGPGALFGVGILCLGIPVLMIEYYRESK
ncbi:MAG TPA: amino acid permease [Halalkalibaculum sp.]|nr:amino acid permease [Halalkalibaculum sp.]